MEKQEAKQCQNKAAMLHHLLSLWLPGCDARVNDERTDDLCQGVNTLEFIEILA
jgi:hypothetical protein